MVNIVNQRRHWNQLGLLALLFATGLGAAAPSYGWWDLGHATICEQAMSALSSNTRAQVEALLDGEDFGHACGWADRVRKERPESAPWHYINLPSGVKTIHQADHPEAGDIITALNRQLAILADAQAEHAQRAEALRFVGHLVGDLHQPMHLGYASDWGGNKYRLAINTITREAIGGPKRSFVNMHEVWDGYLLIYATKTQHRSLDALSRTLNIQPEGTITDWADASLALLNEPQVHYAGDGRLSSLSTAYLDQNYQSALRRLRQAAVNLAQLLEQTFNAPPIR